MEPVRPFLRKQAFLTFKLLATIALFCAAGEARGLPVRKGSQDSTSHQSGCKPIVFLHKTHRLSSHFIEAAKFAKAQVEGCNGYYRALYVTDHHNQIHDNQTVDLQPLYMAIGEESVVSIGPSDISVTYGRSWEELQKSHPYSSFAWAHCDAPELVWYALFSRDLPLHLTQVWASEYDIGWTGDITHLLSSLPAKPDVVCSAVLKPEEGLNIYPSWLHFRARTWLQDSEVRHCMVMLIRYSLRYLAAFLAETRMGHWQFCEMSAPSICLQHKHWCSAYAFDDSLDILGRDPNGAAMFTWDRVVSEQEWREIQSRAPPGPDGHIYHGLKW